MFKLRKLFTSALRTVGSKLHFNRSSPTRMGRTLMATALFSTYYIFNESIVKMISDNSIKSLENNMNKEINKLKA
jgi:hypothetical protein